MCTVLAVIAGLVVAVGFGIWAYVYADLHGRVVH